MGILASVTGVVLIACSLTLAIALQVTRSRNGVHRLSRMANTKAYGTDEADVTVIIPARNEASAIAGCLQTLIPQSVIVEIIVVNDHSSGMCPDCCGKA